MLQVTLTPSVSAIAVFMKAEGHWKQQGQEEWAGDFGEVNLPTGGYIETTELSSVDYGFECKPPEGTEVN